MCLVTRHACIVGYLITDELYKFILVLMHLNFMHQGIKPKIPGRLVHNLFLGERNELLQVSRQQTHVSVWSCNR